MTALMDSCDRYTAVGRRDFAVLVLLAGWACGRWRSPPWTWTTSAGGRADRVRGKGSRRTSCRCPGTSARRWPAGSGTGGPRRARRCSCRPAAFRGLAPGSLAQSSAGPAPGRRYVRPAYPASLPRRRTAGGRRVSGRVGEILRHSASHHRDLRQSRPDRARRAGTALARAGGVGVMSDLSRPPRTTWRCGGRWASHCSPRSTICGISPPSPTAPVPST